MGIRFVTGESVTLPLSDGDSITIKKQLSHGERDAMYALMRANPNAIRSAELAAHLVGWSAATPYKANMPDQERIDILNGLDPDSFDEITAAVKAHLDEANSKKKPQNGGPESSSTSASANATTGDTNGSQP